MQKSERGG